MNMSYPNPDSVFPFAAQTNMNRDELQQKYIEWDLEQMNHGDLIKFFIDTQNRELGDLDDDELVEDVKQFAPHLLK